MPEFKTAIEKYAKVPSLVTSTFNPVAPFISPYDLDLPEIAEKNPRYFSQDTLPLITRLVDTARVQNQSGLIPDKVKNNEEPTGGFHLSGFLNSEGAKGIMSLGGAGLGTLNSINFQNTRYASNPTEQGAFQARGAVSDMMLQSGNPWAMLAGFATKIGDGIMDATGMRSDQISKRTQEKAGLSGAERFLNNSMNYLPGNPLAMGGSKISDAEMSMEAERLRGAYAGTLDDMDAAQNMGGKRVNFMLGGARNKMNDFVVEQNANNQMLTTIGQTNTLRKQNDSAQNQSMKNQQTYNGDSYSTMKLGKVGLKLPDRATLDRIYAARKAKEVQEFKDGGVIGIDSNIIPEGALHKELNHMEDHNEELDKVITDKGVAVVVTDEKGNVEQIAEIEREEIIFTLDTTKVLEDALKEWQDTEDKEKKDAILLKIGKFLTKEIMENTDDNTGEMLDGNDES